MPIVLGGLRYGSRDWFSSNGRKNRSGETMEGILERSVAKGLSFVWIRLQSSSYSNLFIKENWNIDVPVDKSQRRFDVAVYSKEKHKVWLMKPILWWRRKQTQGSCRRIYRVKPVCHDFSRQC